MSENVVVLGSGYAGAGAVQSLESSLGRSAELTWVSDVDYHLVLHESHRCIRDPSVREEITIPVHEIKSSSTTFRQGRVVGVDTDDRTVELEDGEVEYDYLLVAVGSSTAFFGIEGLEAYAHQTAGEVAEYRDDHDAPIDIHLVEGLDRVFPNNDPQLQGALRKRLEAAGVEIHTGEFIGEVDENRVYVGEDTEMAYDVLVWTGGITGRDCVADASIDKDDRSRRLFADRTFETDDDRVFALGDCALVDQPGDNPAPPTAQAAWQAAEVAGENVARRVRGQPLTEWTHKDKGTVVSVGETAVGHDVLYVPLTTFGGTPAKLLKKGIAARWIADIAGVGRAMDAWSDM
ncbi:NADH dehydrogenase FAD-containing subunit [Halobacteriales archaeon QH_3_68_24]|nr:MAG: NADH dehydrogenase FAD-containing subunit [Halobacteriales archaeon QH_3_68_24]